MSIHANTLQMVKSSRNVGEETDDKLNNFSLLVVSLITWSLNKTIPTKVRATSGARLFVLLSSTNKRELYRASTTETTTTP